MAKSTAITVIKLDPPEEREDEWNEWYTNVHSPGRFECGFLGFRRFEIMAGHPQVDTLQSGQAKYLAIMELPNTDVLTSPAYDVITERWMALGPDSFEHQTMGLNKFARGVLKMTDEIPQLDEFALPDTKYVFMSAHEVPAAIVDEFNDWYVTEHIPPVLDQPGFNSVRRYVHLREEFPPMLSRGGELFTHLAIWEIDDETVFQNPVFASYTPTPWQQRMRRLFTLKMSNVYREIGRGVAPA
jgi:hypothetical protein